MTLLIIIGICIASVVAIPVSIHYLGPDNEIEEVAEVILKEELPAVERGIEASLQPRIEIK